jgi:glyoxylase-like metal-dependent hydrolase (beta-lactamase superfamily II)
LARGLRPGEDLEEVRAEMSVINLAGHTPGQIGFWLPRERVAIIADALMHLLPWLHPPFAAFTSDMHRAERSVAKLVALGPRVLIPGHGPPLVAAGEGDLAEQLLGAQARFRVRARGAAEPLLPPASRV